MLKIILRGGGVVFCTSKLLKSKTSGSLLRIVHSDRNPLTLLLKSNKICSLQKHRKIVAADDPLSSLKKVVGDTKML